MFFRQKTKYTIYTYGADILKKKASKITEITPEIRELGKEMLVAMELFEGIGLAGPQYGLDKRIIALNVPASQGMTSPGEAMLLSRMPMVIVNAEITTRSEETDITDEACLSLPGLSAPVERSQFIQFRAQTLDGELIECECGGLLARCLQHEIDHTDGFLYVDRVIEGEFSKIEFKLKRLKKNGRKKDFQKTIWV